MASSEKQLRELAAPVPDLTGVTQPQGTDLTASQQKALETVLAHFSQPDYELSGAKDGEGKLREEEMFWLALTGKEVVFGFDVNGRPALYLCPSRQNTDESIRQVQFNVFMLERCIELMGPGVESVALMIDYGQKSAKSPSISLSRMVLNILQTHYPERLGRALIINVPFLLNAFYKLITPLIDPVTRDKMRFNPKAVEDGLFTVDSVWKEFGGNIEFKYEHSTYWPQFMEMTTARRKVQMEKWHSLGGKVGLKEWDIKGGDDNTQVPDAGEKFLGDSET
ncbi:hypothetical protein PHLCEN_2v12755 [Hermanssonia centrifuga]|uniref:CRAL-TRIO domain-containing protein n=1 Tax=Hermanssonia centrifuga TaxID=98765 RepID=A0A2R6NGD3_9APHY|nr:hypothetical protein PHLCEN_2v12755 [Hermanssonia centrifuga]